MKGSLRIPLFFASLIILSLNSLFSQLNGTYNVPTNYASIGAAINDLNVQGVNGAVLITVNAGHTETVSPGGYTLTASGTSVNTIVFQKIGVGLNPLMVAYSGGVRTPGSSSQDGIWHFVGCDYVTVDGIDLIDPNTTNPSSMEYGFGFFKANASDGCQHNIIRNCSITLNRVNNATGAGPAVDGSRGINVANSLISSQTAALVITAGSGSHSNNGFYANTIQNCNIGISLIGYVAPSPYAFADTNNEIGGNSLGTGNTILNYGGGGIVNPAAAIRTLAQYNLSVLYNTINNNNGSGLNHGTTLRGIYLNTAQSANVIVLNNTLTLNGGGTNAQVSVIENLSGAIAASNSISIEHNLIANCTNANNTTGAFYGIFNNAASSSYLSLSNNVFVNNDLLSSSGSVFLLHNTASVPNSIRFEDNLISNNTFSSSTSGISYFLYNNAISTASLSVTGNTLSNNFRYAGTGATHLIYNAQATAGDVSFTNNVIASNTFSSVSGILYGLYNNGASTGKIDISNNTYTTNTNQSASGAVYSIYNTGATSGSTELSHNLISSDNHSLTTTGTYYGIYNNAASASSISISHNEFQLLQFSTFTGSVHLIYNRGPASTTFALNAIEHNTISSCNFNSASNSPFLGIYNSLVNSGTLSIAHNSIMNLGWASATASKYLILNNGVVGNQFEMVSNWISACTNTNNTTGLFYGLYNTGAVNGDLHVNNNHLDGLSSTANTGASALIYNSASVSGIRSFTSNLLSNCQFNASGSGDFNGIYNSGNNGSRIELSGNTFSNISVDRFSGASYLVQNAGPIATTIGTINILNNLITGYTGSFSSNGSFFALYNNAVSAQQLNISSNTISSSSSTGFNGANHLIYNRGVLTNTFNSVAFLNNSVNNYSFNSNGIGGFFGLYNNGPSVGGVVISSNTLIGVAFNSSLSPRYMVFNSAVSSGSIQLNANLCSNITGTLNTTGVFYFVNTTSGASLDIVCNNNVFSNSQLHASSGDVYFVHNSGVSAGSILLQGNAIQNVNTQQSSSGALYGIYNNAASCSTLEVSGNAISNCLRTSSGGATYWLYARGNGTTLIGKCHLSANSIINLTNTAVSTGPYFGVYSLGGTINELSILSNTINSIEWTSLNANRFLIVNSATVTALAEIKQNYITGITSASNTTGGFYGINNAVSPSTSLLEISSNVLQNFNLGNTTGGVQFISTTGTLSSAVMIEDNLINNYTVNTSGTGDTYGIYNACTSASLISVNENTLSNASLTYSSGSVYDILNTAAGSNSVIILQNKILNHSSSTQGSGAKYIIYNNAAGASELSLHSNTISGIVHSAVNGAVHFVYNRGSLTTTFNAVTFSENLINSCTISASPVLTNQNYLIYNNGVQCNSLSIQSNTVSDIVWQTTLSYRYLIYNTGTSSLGISIQNNVLQNQAAPLNTTGYFYGIYNGSPNSYALNIESNTLQQIHSQSTFGRKYLVLNTGTLSHSVAISSNSLTNNSILSNTAASFFGLYNTANSSSLQLINANVIQSNTASTSNGTMALVLNTGLATNTVNQIVISNNVLSDNTFSASMNGPFYGIHNTGVFSNTLTFVSNVIANQQSPLMSSDRFMYYNTGPASDLISISQNSLSGITFTNNSSGTFYGINNSAACNGSLQILSNVISQLNLSSTTGTNYIIFNTGAVAGSRSINGNSISNSISNSSTSGTYYGIFNRSTASQYLSMSSNTLSNLAITSHSVPLFLIYNTGTSATSVNTVQLNNNEILGGLQKINLTAAFYGVFNDSVQVQDLGLNNNKFIGHSLDVQQGRRFLVYNTAQSASLAALNGNLFSGNTYVDSLSQAFYGVRNVGAFSGQLQMSNNTFSSNIIGTKTSSLYFVCNSAQTNSGAPVAELNGNRFVINTFSITQNKPLYLVCQDGGSLSDLAMNNNSVAANSFLIPSGSVYMIHNLSSVTNTIGLNTNWITTNTNSTNASGDVFFISNYAAQSQSISINSNTIINNESAHVLGTTNLILNGGIAASAIDISNNQLNHQFVNPSQAYSGIFNGIWASQSGSTAALNITSNTFSSITFSAITGLGPLYFVKNSSHPGQLNITGNAFNNLQIKNSGAHYFIHNTGNVQSVLGVYSNTISNYIRQQAGSGDFYFYYANAISVPAACVQSFSSNLIANISSTVGGLGSFYGIYSADGGLGTYPLKSIHHNSINAISYNSNGDFIGYYANYLGDGGLAQSSSIHTNTVSNVSWPGSVFGIYHGSQSSPGESVLIYSNEINNLSSIGQSSFIYPACLNYSSKQIKFYKNKIHSIQALGNSAGAFGIYVGNANTTEISNNRVGKVYAPNSSIVNPVNGIYIAGGSTVHLNYNTVFLDATSAAANFNANAVYASSNPQLSMRNNVLINTSIATGTGINAAYRRSSASIANHAFNSDRNVYYAGPNSANNFIYHDPSNSISAIVNYQTLFSPREGNSQKENTAFLTSVGNAPAFLMVNPAFPSATESGAQNITGITDDFDAQIRQGNPGYAGTGIAPDIGSDEYNQALPPCSTVNSGTIAPVSTTICAGQNITLFSSGYTYTSAGGVVLQWQFSNSASGPFNAVIGGGPSNKTEYTSGALSAGTLYYVLSGTCTNNSQTSVSNQASVVVLPSPTVSITAVTSTLCSGNGVQLNMSTDIGSTFFWTGPANFTSSVQSPSLSNLATFASGIYSVQVGATNACTNSASYTLQVYPAVPDFSYAPANPAVCSGDSVLVSASVPVASPTLVWNPQVNQNPANGYPAPYSMYYGGQKMQFVVQASELLASGFVTGSPITSLEFPVVSLGSAWGNNIQHCQDFQISVGHTTLNSITSFQSGMNVVLPAYNFSPSVGTNVHPFTTPFIWDGTSHLIIETVFSNGIFGSAATSAIQYNSPTGYQSTVVYRADNQSFANIAAATSSNVNVSNARPDFRLNGLPVGTYTWVPSTGLAITSSASTQASPASTQVYTTVLSNGFCTKTNTLTIQVAQHPTLSISSTATLLCVGNMATLAVSGANSYSWSNGSLQSSIAISPAGNTTYTVTGFNQPCPSASAAVQVSVAPALLISAVSQSPVICAGETTTLFANGASSYTWSNGVYTASTLVSPLVNTTYTVFGTSGPGCSAQQIVSVISNSLPVLQVSPASTTVCPGVLVEFVASGALSFTWLPVNLNSSSIVLFPQNSSTYTLVGQGPNQCKNSILVPVVVDPCLKLTELVDSIQLSIYPNPSSGEFTIDFNSKAYKTIEVLTVEGASVLKEDTNEQQFKFNLASQAKGFYIVNVKSGAKVNNFKLLLQ